MKIDIKDPGMRKLLKRLETMPEYLAERRRKIERRREFVREVFGEAARQAFGERIKLKGE